MPVLTRLIPSPVVVDIRPGALADLATVLADERISHSGRLAVAVSGGSGAKLRERVAPQLPGATWYEVDGGTLDDAVRLADDIRAGHFDALVGLGGGKIIDCAKYAAARVGLPLVAVPTNLAHDGLCSPVATWELANRVNGEKIDGLAAAMARQAGEAVLRHPGGIEDNDFLQVLAEALVLSGIAMSVSGDSRPSSGACHEINHAFDLLFPQRAASHGEQCGLGAAFAMYLRGAHEASAHMAGVLRRHGLPVRAEDIGFTVDEFVRVVEFAPETRPGRYTILEHLDLKTDQIKDIYADYVKAIGS
ncbi:iron-containing alcohol dehydrogenase [Streptomyces sp. NRRL F-2799]|uniref:iron-containing alcohol dehydrogenase n=1 Tax=Streptomyces sp. NRRL F-2799 TaxID=1463844 RepID=UPI0004C6DC43|nr:iron-containing alcohol dehydrogenase [Streptomyces sp. NRRL F-2799]